MILTNLNSFDLHSIKGAYVMNIALIKNSRNIILHGYLIVFYIRVTTVFNRFLYLLVCIGKGVGDILIFVKAEGNR